MNALLQWRTGIGRKWTHRCVGDDFSIISDDCWGGQIYRQLGIPYRTPTVGLFVEFRGYLNFISNLRKPDFTELTFIDSAESYPVAQTPYARLHFMHSQSVEEARESFLRRFERINWERLFYKADFGKPGYAQEDVDAWNRLALPNSVALYRPDLPYGGKIHNGVCIGDWQLDGAQMFDGSRRYFDMIHWLRTGELRNGSGYRLLNFLLLDPLAPRRLKNTLLQR